MKGNTITEKSKTQKATTQNEIRDKIGGCRDG